MTSFTSTLTSISQDTSSFPGGTWINATKESEEPKFIYLRNDPQVQKNTLPLGYKLLSLTGIVTLASILLLLNSLFTANSLVSIKFSLFLTLLFGGLTLELLWTKKLHYENE